MARMHEYTAENLLNADVAEKWRVFARLLEVMKHFENVPAMQVNPGDLHRASKAANLIEGLITGRSADPKGDVLGALEMLGINPSAVRSILRP
jgi:hypothetical protein